MIADFVKIGFDYKTNGKLLAVWIVFGVFVKHDWVWQGLSFAI